MRSKQIASIAAFIAAFVVSVAVVPRAVRSTTSESHTHQTSYKCNARKAGKITKLLEEDISNGMRRLDYGKRETYPQRVNAYVDLMKAIKDSQVPSEFRAAWHAHITAWENYSAYLQQLDEEQLAFYDETERHFALNSEISRTWFEVLDIAKEYDALIPAGAYN